MTRKTDVIILGSVRSATTSLFYSLSQHKDIFAFPDKEPNFFIYSGPERNLSTFIIPSSRGSVLARSITHLAQYEALLQDAPPASVIVEASPLYLHIPGTESNILDYNPAIKGIIVSRDPVDIAISLYHALHKGPTPDTYFLSGHGDGDRDHILRYANTPTHIERVRQAFGDKQILVIDYQDVVERPGYVFANISSFIGTSRTHNFILRHFNAALERRSVGGALFSAVDSSKNALRPLLAPKLKRKLLPIYHRWRAPFTSRPPLVPQHIRAQLRERIEATSVTSWPEAAATAREVHTPWDG